MKEQYFFEYKDENDFRKRERAVKKYNMLAYKKLMFDYYPSMRNGKFVGKLVGADSKEKTESYELKLPTDQMFSKVHGDIVLYYTVYKNEHIILLTNITPDVLLEGHRDELTTYKGVMVSKTRSDIDMFKINLLKMLDK